MKSEDRVMKGDLSTGRLIRPTEVQGFLSVYTAR